MIKNGKRELCYVVRIDNIIPIDGAEKVEQAIVGGWHVMVRKNQFKIGDKAVYFEIDSKVPEKEPFKFLASKHYKIKTQKYFKGTIISQGLLMAFEDFGWENNKYEVGIPLTKELDVKYSVVEDNKRKSTTDKYKKMAQRHAKLFKNSKFIQWLYKKTWGKKILFFFLGNKKDVRASFWPDWVKKTDEERCQNLPQLFPNDDRTWMVTEKLDGSSTTFTIKKGKRNKYEFYVCSRNVCFDKPEKEDKLYYDTNIYTKMAEKYDIENVLKQMLEDTLNAKFITIQGETYGAGVQKRDYGMTDIDFAAFNLIYGFTDGTIERLNPEEMAYRLDQYGIPSVPILDIEFKLPDTIDEMIAYADGNSEIDGEYREGVVLRTLDGLDSFKAVSNEYLLKKGE